MRWHSYLTPPAAGSRNMAVDEALMLRAARTGDAVFRVYGWSAPTLSLGRNQRARECYDQALARELGVQFVRRPTGGRALLHDREVTYSATLPVAHAAQARAAYDFINDVLLEGLSRLGIGASKATGTRSMRPGLRPCFDLPAEHEIVVSGRKLVGSAQWRRDGALLQHGSILVHNDQGLIARLMKDKTMAEPVAATLAHELGREPSLHDVVQPLVESLRRATGAAIPDLEPDDELNRDVDRLCDTYRGDSWTWRR